MMANAKVAELDPPPGTSPPGPWLETMAGEWVKRWLTHGGWLIVNSGCDKVQMGMSMPSYFRLTGTRHPWKTKGYAHDHRWHDGWKVGRWRELGEMAGYVPGLYDAIVHHVASHGVLDPSGSIVMTRTAEEMGVI